MEFELSANKNKITKEFLLSKNTQETYMETYTGGKVGKGLFLSIFRNDKHVTCSIYKTRDGIVLYHDFATGYVGDCFKVVQTLYGLNYYQALRKIAEDFGYIEKTSTLPTVKPKITNKVLEEKEDVDIKIEKRDFTSNELNWWKSFGISKSTLEYYKVFACDSVFLRGEYYGSSSIRSYIFGYYGGLKNQIQLWRIYFPQKKSFRFLSNWSKNMLQGIKQLPDTGDVLVITKSQKDVMCLYELGIAAIAPTSEVLFVTKQQLDRLKKRFKHIIVWYDNDRPGKHNMYLIRKKYPELTYFLIPNEYKSKDISDFYKQHGKIKTKDFINKYLNLLYVHSN